MIYGGPRTVVSPDLLLLDSKLSVPRPRPGFVSRAGLIDRAREGGFRVIGVTAPAGYGKSTFAGGWGLAEGCPGARAAFGRSAGRPAPGLSCAASRASP